MATIENLYFSLLSRDVEQIDLELSELEGAMNRPGGDNDRAIIVSRIQGAARGLKRKLERESATLWMLFEDPARHLQVKMIHQRIGRIFDRILGLLGPKNQRYGDDSLADKIQKIQELNSQIAGHGTLEQALVPDASYWQQAPGRGLEADPWSSLVLLSAILFDFIHVILRRPKD